MLGFRFLHTSQDLSLALEGRYQLVLVILSILIACLASYSALGLAERAERSHSNAGTKWWFAASLILGLGIWAMHFVGMLAYQLPIPVTYDPVLTLISILPAILASGVVLRLMLRASLAPIQIVLLGSLLGAGIASMHYLGMQAMLLQADMFFDRGLVGVSALVCMLAATIAIYTNRWVWCKEDCVELWVQRVVAGLVMGGAVSAMHYIGMTAAYFFPGRQTLQIDALDPEVLGSLVAAAVFIVLGAALFVSIIDRRLVAANMAVEMSRNQLYHAIENVSDGFTLFDSDDRLLVFNNRFRQLSGIDDLTPGIRFEDLMRQIAERIKVKFPEFQVDEWIKERLTLLQHPEQRIVQELEDGQWMQINANKTDDGGLVAVYTDITAIKRAELELREREELLERRSLEATLLHQAAQIAAETDGFHQSLQQIVDLICKLTNWPEGHVYEVQGGVLTLTPIWFDRKRVGLDQIRKLVTREDGTVGTSLAHSIMASGEPTLFTDTSKVQTLQESVSCEIQQAIGFPVRIRGQIVAILEFLSDRRHPLSSTLPKILGNVGRQLGRVFERRAAESELRKARVAAEAASQAKSRFLSGMSHELRTPLNGILGYAQLLQKDDSKLGEKQKRQVAAVAASGEHLLTLIDDVLDLSKIEAGRVDVVPVSCRLESILPETVEIVRSEAESKGLELRTEFSSRLPPEIEINAVKLRQILLNLLGNAVKFTSNGSVSLRVKTLPDNHLEMVVGDTGLGMSEKELETVFEPFRQGSAGLEKGGTGLGLSITRHLIEIMDGELEVESRPGEGTTFRIILPFSTKSVTDRPSVEVPDTRATPTLRNIPFNPVTKRTNAGSGEETSTVACLAPPERERLAKALEMGDFQAVKELAEDLKKGVSSQPLGQRIGRLAVQFDFEQLKKILNEQANPNQDRGEGQQ